MTYLSSKCLDSRVSEHDSRDLITIEGIFSHDVNPRRAARWRKRCARSRRLARGALARRRRRNRARRSASRTRTRSAWRRSRCARPSIAPRTRGTAHQRALLFAQLQLAGRLGRLGVVGRLGVIPIGTCGQECHQNLVGASAPRVCLPEQAGPTAVPSGGACATQFGVSG